MQSVTIEEYNGMAMLCSTKFLCKMLELLTASGENIVTAQRGRLKHLSAVCIVSVLKWILSTRSQYIFILFSFNCFYSESNMKHPLLHYFHGQKKTIMTIFVLGWTTLYLIFKYFCCCQMVARRFKFSALNAAHCNSPPDTSCRKTENNPEHP